MAHRATRHLLIAAATAIAVLAVLATSATAPARGPAPAVPKTFYGIVPQTPLLDADIDRMGQGQIGTLRILMNWASVDQTAAADDNDWSQIDLAVAAAARNGIQVVPFVFGTPPWVAQTLDNRSCSVERCVLLAPTQAAALAEWKRFLGEAVARYGPNGTFFADHPELPPTPIVTWQLWNEMNSKSFYLPKPNVNAYAALVTTGAEAIRGVDPAAKILLGGMYGYPGGVKKPKLFAWNFLRKLYAIPGFANQFEGVAVHPYAARLSKVKEQTKLMRKEITKAGDNAELWVTEVGWSSATGKNPLQRGKKGQASRLKEAMRYFLAKRTAFNIAGVTWFAWRDLAGTPICDWCGKAGLFDVALAPKPAWNTLMTFTGGS